MSRLDEALRIGSKLLAEQTEKELGDWQHAPGLSPEAKQRLISRIEQLEKEKAQES